MKKLMVVAVILVAGVVPVSAMADGAGYGTQPGFAVANANTACAGHGAFGAFSGDPGAVHQYVLEDQALGTSLGAETGPANSNLCGNPQH